MAVRDPFQLPKPQDFGYPGGMKIQRTDVQMPKVEDPQYAFPKQEMQVPDVVNVRYGAGDKNIVGSLLKAANGQESGLTGVTSTYAAKLLQTWGYPTTADAWTRDQWEQGIGSNAAMVNPTTMLGGY